MTQDDTPPGDPPRGRRPLRPAPVKVRGVLGPPAPGPDGVVPSRSRGVRPAAPTAGVEPLGVVPGARGRGRGGPPKRDGG